MRDFDIVGGEIAQRRRRQPHQPVEDDFEHRQALVADQRRVDQRLDAGEFDIAAGIGVEAEQAVDLVLVEHAVGRRRRRRRRRLRAWRPIRPHASSSAAPRSAVAARLRALVEAPVVAEFVLFARARHHCTRISLKRMRFDLRREDRDVDAAAQLFLEPVDAGRAFEVALAQLAQIDLERIDHLGHARLDFASSPLRWRLRAPW